jgi:hypothetical protein
MRLTERIGKLFAPKSGDLLPSWLIYPGVVTGVAAAAIGLTWRPQDFLVNITADLTLLAFGLIITNRVVRSWRERLVVPQLESKISSALRIAAPLLKMNKYALSNYRDAKDIDTHANTFGDLETNLTKSLEVLKELLDSTETHQHLRVTVDMIEAPKFDLIESIITTANSLHPLPECQLAIMMASSVHRTAIFELTYYSNPSLGSTHGIVMTCVGFDNFTARALECHVTATSRKERLDVYNGSYLVYLAKMNHGLVAMMSSLRAELPSSMSSRVDSISIA